MTLKAPEDWVTPPHYSVALKTQHWGLDRWLRGSFRGPTFSSQLPNTGSQMPATSGLGDPTFSSVLCWHCMSRVYRQTHSQTPIHVKYKNKLTTFKNQWLFWIVRDWEANVCLQTGRCEEELPSNLWSHGKLGWQEAAPARPHHARSCLRCHQILWLSKGLGRSSDLNVMTTEFNVSILLFKNIHCESKRKKKKNHICEPDPDKQLVWNHSPECHHW